MSGIKYLRNGEDDPIFIKFKNIKYDISVGSDVKNETERQEVIEGLPSSLCFGTNWLEDNGKMDLLIEFMDDCVNEISNETDWCISGCEDEFQ